MAKKENKKFCKDCEKPSIYHIQTWIDEIEDCLVPALPNNIFFDKLGIVLYILLEKTLVGLKLGSMKDDFTSADILPRSNCFIEEAIKRGAKFKVFCSRFGYTNHFQVEVNKKTFRFESLPSAEFVSRNDYSLVENKERAREHLKKGKFPITNSKAFWIWQKKKAIKFGTVQIGFPLVVKPRNGSLSRHVTTNIQDIEGLKQAIGKAVLYSPAFMVEKFISDSSIYRATVVDFNTMACVKQVPANVVGDGISTIGNLIDKKNNDPQRGEPRQKQFTLYKIVKNEATEELLSEKGRNLSTVLKKDEIVYLQRDPFLKLGGDLMDQTLKVHSDNVKLFKDIARFFDIRLVGIDFLAKDVSRSWKEQECAVIELNSLPCIEMHHFPSFDRSQNVAEAVVNLLFKYYL